MQYRSSSKTTYLQDAINIKESLNNNNWLDNLHSGLKTRILFKNPETGEVIFEGHNKLILPGAGLIARKLFDFSDSYEITPSYNTQLNLENTEYSTVDMSKHKVYLWCVGTSGCGSENSQVYDVDYRFWIDENSIVPFQYVETDIDVPETLRKVYYGRKPIDGTKYCAYYFKTFDSDPQLVQQFTDGTPIDSTIYSTTSTLPVETYVTMSMSISKYDCRDYFIATTGINDARINTISLCTAWYKEKYGYKWYQDIRPLTRLNFPNEPLIDLRKGIDIVYEVYF